MSTLNSVPSSGGRPQAEAEQLEIIQYKNPPKEFVRARRSLLDLYRQLHASLRPVDSNFKDVCNRITGSVNDALLELGRSGYKPKDSVARWNHIVKADEHLFEAKVMIDNLFFAGVIPSTKKACIAKYTSKAGKDLRDWLKASNPVKAVDD